MKRVLMAAAVLLLTACEGVAMAAEKTVKEYPGGGRFEGAVNADGQPHGQGVMTVPDGYRYDGEFRYGKRHGQGVYTWPDGTRHEGEWRDDQPHGQGVSTWPDGRRYEGRFREGQPHGQGVSTTPAGTRYEGEVNADGEPHGQGVMTGMGGRMEGEWRDGKLNGQGVMTGMGGRMEGEWRDGKLNGQGVMTFPVGRYEGEFRDGWPHGQGAETRPDGTRYEGGWRDGAAHGHGVLTHLYHPITQYRVTSDSYDVPKSRVALHLNANWVFQGEDGGFVGASRWSWRIGSARYRGVRAGARQAGTIMALHRPSRRTINRLRAKNCKIRGKSHLIEDHSGKDGLTLPDGERYEGEWRDGEYHGQGVLRRLYRAVRRGVRRRGVRETP